CGGLDRPFDVVRAELERPRAGVVFTAHPTFALEREGRRALGRAADGAGPVARAFGPPQTVALAEEHEDALAAIERAHDAIASLLEAAALRLETAFPADWFKATPAPISVSTWVGYDLDGRTDIAWSETFRIRLFEKARQLERYARKLEAAAPGVPLAGRLRAAAALALRQSEAFARDLDDPANVVDAANLLTSDHPDKLVSLKDVIAELGALVADAPDAATRRRLWTLKAEADSVGLGVARVHLRVNAAQVRSAVRADLGIDVDSEFLDRTALDAAAARAEQAEARRVNFSSIFREQMTARRQMMLAAQMRKHVDADQPIRFLIAEIEAPATVMSALYLARLYGVDDVVDISPLFETPEALDRAGRFIERLLSEEAFRDYLRRRGRIAVQLGFSDSGRFMGQAAAQMAIERVHILLSRALAASGLSGVSALIFNTHGESMGRGGHPGDFAARLDHLMTPWARSRFARDGAPVIAESSFQGGDGYLHFETEARARATIEAVAVWASRSPQPDWNDAYYADINFSWDVFRTVKTWQEALFADPHYQATLSVIGPNLLPAAGSRKTRRQSGSSVHDVARSLRAIPNNAILQTLAAPANVWGGFGAIAAREPERFAALLKGSPRLRALLDLAREARRLTSLSALRSYGAIYSPGFWTVLAARAGAAAEADRATLVAERLSRLALDVDLGRLADTLSVDRRRFDGAALGERHEGDDAFDPDLYLLHAVRMALIIEGFQLAASTPGFSPRHEATRESVVDWALELRFAELADLVDEIFPESEAAAPAFARLAEPADAETSPAGYPEMRRRVSDPLREIDRLMKTVAVALSHFYNAYG
ncbi:MAG: phosphoenolpyruvate carboxylase, partial [Parvularculaceae bacterium]|nr:phosphoenolpyruvate carboxylase [Parvularculaceae bacterium]